MKKQQATTTPHLSEEELRVRRWRFEQFVRAGLDDEDAALLAQRPDVDVRLVERMLQRGCQPRTVLEIVL